MKITEFPRVSRITYLLAIMVFVATGLSIPDVARGEDPLRVYFLGNSLTRHEGVKNGGDTERGVEFEPLVEAGGHGITPGTFLLDNHTLTWLWNDLNGLSTPGKNPPPTGGYLAKKAEMQNNVWDVVSIQSYRKPLVVDDGTGSVANAGNFIDLFLNGSSPDPHVYVYSHWVSKPTAGKYDEDWTATYTGGTYNARTQSYFEQMTDALRDDYPMLDVHMIPIGDVLLELDTRIKNAEEGDALDAFEGMEDWYQDPTHLSRGIAVYAAAVTIYATLYGEDPTGLSYDMYQATEMYRTHTPIEITDELALAVQDAAWDVVNGHEYSGVPEPATMSLLAIGGIGMLVRRRRRRA